MWSQTTENATTMNTGAMGARTKTTTAAAILHKRHTHNHCHAHSTSDTKEPRKVQQNLHILLIPSIVLALPLSISPSLNVTQIQGATKQGLLSPPQHGGILYTHIIHTCLRFCHDKTLALSSLVNSHRIAPNHAASRSQQLIPVYFLL